jgi:hypothetical protein
MCQEQVSFGSLHGVVCPLKRYGRLTNAACCCRRLCRITRAFLIEEANIVKRVLKAQAVAPKKK